MFLVCKTTRNEGFSGLMLSAASIAACLSFTERNFNDSQTQILMSSSNFMISISSAIFGVGDERV